MQENGLNDVIKLSETLKSSSQCILFTGEEISAFTLDSLLNGEKVIENQNASEFYRKLKKLHTHINFSKIITQNIDNGHLKSGIQLSELLEYHGNYTRGICINCGFVQELQISDYTPIDSVNLNCCRCKGHIKSSIIDFGDIIDEQIHRKAIEVAMKSDMCVVIGSDLIHHPSSDIPNIITLRQKKLILITKNVTPFDKYAYMIFRDKPIEIINILLDQIS